MPQLIDPQDKVRPEPQEKLRPESNRPERGANSPFPAIRRSIAEMALSFVRDAHYLEGTAGNTPGGHDGNPGGGKKEHVDLLPPIRVVDVSETRQRKVLSINVAAQGKFKGFNSCAGRRSRFTQPSQDDLRKYLAAVDVAARLTQDQTFWPGHGANQLHPRRYFLFDTLAERGNVVWGESCDGRKHFDCVGLVNYCLEEHTNKPGGWAFEIKQYHKSEITGTSIVSPFDVTNGDIVVRLKDAAGNPDEHIGLLFNESGKFFVVQAEDTKKGLTASTVYKPSEWEKVVRVKEAFLLPRQHKLTDGKGQ